jgi:phosphonate utilization associated putative membrane protein
MSLGGAALAIAGSVVMHVTWNLLARHVDRRCNYLWWGLLAHTLIFGVWGLLRLAQDASWSPPLLAAIGCSATAIAVYFWALRHAYHYAPVAFVYPVARSSPLLVAVFGWLLFGVELNPWGWLGILVSFGGLLLMSLTSRHGDTRHAVPWALLAVLCTTVYSLSDKAAVSYLPTFGSLMGFASISYLAAFLALTVLNRREHGRWIPASRPPWRYMLAGGLCLGPSYVLVIYAMRWLEAAHAVSYVNAGIVLATLLSIALFREREAWRTRLAAALLITLGLVIMTLDLT